MPIGQGLWTVTVNNASSGPITDLEVDVYAVDGDGNRLEDACHPAKGKISLQELLREIMAGGMSGTLDAIGSRATSMYPPGMFEAPANLGSYGGMFSDYLMGAPGLASLLQNAQQQMVDKYPDVIARDQSAEVMYSAPGAAEVRVDLQFADDMGNLWRRRHGQQPEPVMENE
ncbi:hypothetical protein JW365_21480 [Gordonia sp. BP-94]|uniref:hypothetical protein n=1 Tax=Gordonia sp. BP-94 TaxID=2812552 RepID=UPI00196366EF|nr:hypothetical protein [Gordonia sp. BP-94]MBN0975087.1 hypothetical protein [Gordonia sp. BP-119]MBN0985260.1 hypothetical protein [Gordonia sp. BP-94]